MVESDKHKKLKTTVDLISGLLIVALLSIPWALDLAPPTFGDMIITFSLLLGLPSLFSIIWLEVRYAEVLEKRFPGISRWQPKIAFFLLIVTLFIPLRLMMHPN